MAASACSAELLGLHRNAAHISRCFIILQAEQKLWLQNDPSDMMNDIIYNVRKVHPEVLL